MGRLGSTQSNRDERSGSKNTGPPSILPGLVAELHLGRDEPYVETVGHRLRMAMAGHVGNRLPAPCRSGPSIEERRGLVPEAEQFGMTRPVRVHPGDRPVVPATRRQG